MAKYLVNEPLNHDQKEYPAGSFVEMTEDQAAALLSLKVISEDAGEPVKRINAADSIALVKTIQDIAELDQLATDNQDRKSVLDAIDKRRKELEQ